MPDKWMQEIEDQFESPRPASRKSGVVMRKKEVAISKKKPLEGQRFRPSSWFIDNAAARGAGRFLQLPRKVDLFIQNGTLREMLGN